MNYNALAAIGSRIAAAAALLLPASTALAGAQEKILYSFSGSPGAAVPEAGLIFDGAGNLYGTSTFGGKIGPVCSSGCGTVFELKPGGGKWTETVLHSFGVQNGEGAYPEYELTFDTAGNLYSTTEVGGGLGEAFELAHMGGAWHLDVLHAFQGGGDGQQPRAALIFDTAGNLFGTTVSGGGGGNGTVFELSPGSGNTWTESVLHRFLSGKAGAAPQAGLLRDLAGNLYGTTTSGGNPTCPGGCGTVFELVRSGNTWKEHLLHAFSGSDGRAPVGELVADSAGNLYGTTGTGGNANCINGCGAVFKLGPTKDGWKLTVLHMFSGNDGDGPQGNIVRDAAGNLYGTTIVGGNLTACPQQHGCGVVYALAPGAHGTWKFHVLHSFQSGLDGSEPSGLVADGAGMLYGTTRGGGAAALGTVFEVAP